MTRSRLRAGARCHGDARDERADAEADQGDAPRIDSGWVCAESTTRRMSIMLTRPAN